MLTDAVFWLENMNQVFIQLSVCNKLHLSMKTIFRFEDMNQMFRMLSICDEFHLSSVADLGWHSYVFHLPP